VLYAAGDIDGIKNKRQQLWYITLPMVKPYNNFRGYLAAGSIVMLVTAGFGRADAKEVIDNREYSIVAEGELLSWYAYPPGR
jgi:ABC-type polysaccharide transport system permease subunit